MNDQSKSSSSPSSPVSTPPEQQEPSIICPYVFPDGRRCGLVKGHAGPHLFSVLDPPAPPAAGREAGLRELIAAWRQEVGALRDLSRNDAARRVEQCANQLEKTLAEQAGAREAYIQRVRSTTAAIADRIGSADVGQAGAGAAPTADTEAAHRYISDLLTRNAPHCEPLPDLLGLATQIDNLIAGLKRAAAPREGEPPTE